MNPNIEPTNQGHRILVLTLVILLTAGVIGGSTYYVLSQQNKAQQKLIDELQKTASDAATQKKEKKKTTSEAVVQKDEIAQEGYMEGSFTYPSSFIPDNIIAYAENISTGEKYNSSEVLSGSQFTYNKGYKIKVPVGDYYVYAMVPPDTTKAYYSKFVTCGMSVDCKDTSKILVKVELNKTSGNITLGDWYNQPGL